MKYFSVQIMDHNFCLLSAVEARKILKDKNFKTIKLGKETHSILVRIKDLIRIKQNVEFLLDDDGTELNNSDIQKIISDENIICE